jgi:hypothetical protein
MQAEFDNGSHKQNVHFNTASFVGGGDMPPIIF